MAAPQPPVEWTTTVEPSSGRPPWPATDHGSPMRWSRAAMAGVSQAVGDPRWAAKPTSLRLVDFWLADTAADRPCPLDPVEVATRATVVDLGAQAGLRLEISGHLVGVERFAAGATVAARGDGLHGGDRPTPLRPPAPPDTSEPPRSSETAAADTGTAGLAEPVTLPVDAASVAALLEWLDDDTPIHHDPDAARSAGLPGPIAPGLWVLAVLAQHLRSTSASRVTAIGARFVRPAVIGESLQISGGTGPGRVRLRATGPSGEVVRKAWADLTSTPDAR